MSKLSRSIAHTTLEDPVIKELLNIPIPDDLWEFLEQARQIEGVDKNSKGADTLGSFLMATLTDLKAVVAHINAHFEGSLLALLYARTQVDNAEGISLEFSGDPIVYLQLLEEIRRVPLVDSGPVPVQDPRHTEIEEEPEKGASPTKDQVADVSDEPEPGPEPEPEPEIEPEKDTPSESEEVPPEEAPSTEEDLPEFEPEADPPKEKTETPPQETSPQEDIDTKSVVVTLPPLKELQERAEQIGIDPAPFGKKKRKLLDAILAKEEEGAGSEDPSGVDGLDPEDDPPTEEPPAEKDPPTPTGGMFRTGDGIAAQVIEQPEEEPPEEEQPEEDDGGPTIEEEEQPEEEEAPSEPEEELVEEEPVEEEKGDGNFDLLGDILGESDGGGAIDISFDDDGDLGFNVDDDDLDLLEGDAPSPSEPDEPEEGDEFPEIDPESDPAIGSLLAFGEASQGKGLDELAKDARRLKLNKFVDDPLLNK